MCVCLLHTLFSVFQSSLLCFLLLQGSTLAKAREIAGKVYRLKFDQGDGSDAAAFSPGASDGKVSGRKYRSKDIPLARTTS
jgi:hypothetical protein